MMVVTRPAANIVLNVMEQRVHAVELALDRSAVVLMFGGMNVLGYFQQLIGFGVRFAESRIVRIVVVQVEQEFVGQRFKASGKVVYV